MKKDIFLATKKKIIAISTSVVFACLIVFAIIALVVNTISVLAVKELPDVHVPSMQVSSKLEFPGLSLFRLSANGRLCGPSIRM